jgi:NADP-dependent 3-hydroxy acid dehydrogenase YdfG
MTISNKVIAIAGASSGIGEATARLLAKNDATLVLGARRLEKLSAVATAIADDGGVALTTELDVTNRTSMDKFIEYAHDRFGRIDVLINSAGIMMLAPLIETRRDEWDRMIDVNLRGVLNGVAAVLPHMILQGSGHIVLIGSTSGRRVAPTNGIYAATKFAVRAIAESLRIEGGAAIRSTLISAGATRTELTDKIDHPLMREAVRARADEMLPADAIARAISYAIEQPQNVDVSEIIVRPLTMKE